MLSLWRLCKKWFLFFRKSTGRIIYPDNVCLIESRFLQIIISSLIPFSIAGSFLPTDLSGLHTWYDAGQGITLNGGDVPDWANQGGGSGVSLKQTVAADQPLYNSSDTDFNNKPSVEFDGVSENLGTDAFTGLS